ncbi:MAG: hypothetical protein NTX56_18675 [Proteobacteria bacterium]|nr:hypothetical protein [Pseudomonadota bacterium]
MAISSLTKFTVPLATSQSASTQGLLMPKLRFRYRVSFIGFGVSASNIVELTKQVKTFKRPSPTFETIVIDTYNSKVNLLGKPKWEAVSCVVRDDAAGNISKLVGEQLQKQFDFMEQSSAASGVDYKFVTHLEMLDGGNGAHEPHVLETWEMYGCLLSGVEYGDVDYASNETVDITLNIMFDNAIQTPQGTGVGTNVGRTLGKVITG